MGLWENPRYYISAYGLAVKHGFEGTEEEWIASLKGEKGDPGDVSAASIAKAYSGEETYVVGEYCWQFGQLYCCVSAIEVPEEWNGDHWIEAMAADEIQKLNNGKTDKVEGGTAGNFAGLDEDGNLTDSGHKHSDYKTVQGAVSDPTAAGMALTFIDSISQNAQGVIAPTKKTVPLDTELSSGSENPVQNKVIKAAIDSIANAVSTPLMASAAADMTDHDKIYVYTGTTGDGLTKGHWYYWDSSLATPAWADGGTYNATAFTTDTTLAVSGAAADAKVTGDKIGDLKSALNNIYHHVEFTVAANSSHSGSADRLAVNLTAGKKVYILWVMSSYSTGGENMKLYNGNGTAVYEFDKEKEGYIFELIPSQNIVSIGSYVGTTTTAIDCAIYVSENKQVLYSILKYVENSVLPAINSLGLLNIAAPIVTNGSGGNPGNTNLVTARAIPLKSNIQNILVYNSRPVTASGNYYRYMVSAFKGTTYYTSRISDIVANNGIFSFNPADVIGSASDVDGFGVTVYEYDSLGNAVSIREKDFPVGTLIIQYIPVSSLDYFVISPEVTNGTGGNPDNPNFVTIRAVSFKEFTKKIAVTNSRPVTTTGNYYRYMVSAFKGANYYTSRISGIIADDGVFSFDPQDIILSNSDVDGFGVTIYEYDSSGNVVTLRKTDFPVGTVKIRFLHEDDDPANEIIKRNNDIRPNVDASCYFGHHGNGSWNINKKFQMLITTDIHGDYKRFKSAINYLNEIEPIDIGICLGDMALSNWTSPYEWYAKYVNEAKKNWLTVIGNHDGGNGTTSASNATVDQEFSRWIEPTLSKIGDTSIDKTYYSFTNSTHKIKLIVLNVHDVPDDTASGSGDFLVSRGAIGYSQEQINWLCEELSSVPSNYTLVIALHQLPDDITLDSGVWTNINAVAPTSTENCYAGMIPELINAWMNGLTLTKDYKNSSSGGAYDEYLPTISVSVDFSERGTGTFAGYFAGHTHQDFVGHCTDYPNQKYYCFDTTCNDSGSNVLSDLPRTYNTKEEDCITAVTIDTSKKEVRLVRIGSNFTINMTKREYFVGNYL